MMLLKSPCVSFHLFLLLLNTWHWLLRPSTKDTRSEDPTAVLEVINDIEDEEVEEQKVVEEESSISFTKYYRYAQIQNYLNKLELEYPHLITLENYGVSYEERNLTLIYISSGSCKSKPIIFIDAGIHAREWIAPAQALYIINQILESDENSYLKNKVDWIIIPLLNPDGYEYAHTVDRNWRKTRSIGQECAGVDPNRNFDYYWGGMGSSRNECSNVYAGPKAFSEPETRALSQILLKYANRTKLYLTFHSPAQCFLHPWGYSLEFPPNVYELKCLAKDAEKAVMAVNGTRYGIGSSATFLSFASGCSRDWAYGVARIPLAYTMELPYGNGNSFDMPKERIYSVVTEMFQAVKVFHDYVVKKYVK